jgi:trans-aconitate methyltransferase
VRQYFESLLQKHGNSPKALDWSPEGQRRRFEVLADIQDLQGLSVLDVGCGLGHLYDFLRGRLGGVDYFGLDLSPRMVEHARKRNPSASFAVYDASADSLPRRADIVFSSGMLNVEIGNNEDAMRTLLRACFSACRLAAGVNMLSTWADRFDPDRHYYDPLRIVRAAHVLTPRVSLRHDYMPHDFTLYLYRNP